MSAQSLEDRVSALESEVARLTMFVMGTDHVSLVERADSPDGARLRSRLEKIDSSEQAVTIISFEEPIAHLLRD